MKFRKENGEPCPQSRAARSRPGRTVLPGQRGEPAACPPSWPCHHPPQGHVWIPCLGLGPQCRDIDALERAWPKATVTVTGWTQDRDTEGGGALSEEKGRLRGTGGVTGGQNQGRQQRGQRSSICTIPLPQQIWPSTSAKKF